MADLQKELEAELAKDKTALSKEDTEKVAESFQRKNYLSYGIHEVFIKSVELFKAPNTGTIGIKFNVENDKGISDAMFWLSPNALRISIESIGALVVHNTAADKKETAREFLKGVTTGSQIYEVAKDKLIGGVGFLTIEPGEEYDQRQLRSWKPKNIVKPEDIEDEDSSVVGGEPVDLSSIPF